MRRQGCNMMFEQKMMVTVVLVFLLFLLQGNRVYAMEGDYVHQQALSADRQLAGISDSFDEYFYIGDWKLTEVFLTLYYVATPLVDQERSVYTIYLNGKPVFSDSIKAQGDLMQGVRILLPVRELKQGMNLLSLRTYMRTVGDEQCADEVSGAAWMSVEKESAVTVCYRPLDRNQGVAAAYEEFLSVQALENEESVVAINELPSETELSMAADALINLSAAEKRFGTGILMDIYGEWEQEKDNPKHILYVSEYDNLNGDVAAMLTEEQKNQAQEEAIIVSLSPNANQTILLVTGSSQSALSCAVKMLGNRDYMRQIQAGWKKVYNQAEGVQQPVRETETIALSERYANGPFRQTISYYIEQPAEIGVAEGTELLLSFRYAKNLDFDRALVTAYINGKPIGSQKLTLQKADGDTVVLRLLDDLNITGAFELSIAFDLEMTGPLCEVRREEMPWAFVTGESELFLKTKEIPELFFEYYPHPFIKAGEVNDLLLVLPDSPTEADYYTMRSVLLYLGQSQYRNTKGVRVETGFSKELEAEAGKYNIIAIGIYANNALAKRCNETLSFSFSPKGTTIASNEKMEIEPAYGAGLGTVSLMKSPFGGQDKALMLVSGVTEQGMKKAAAYLAEKEEKELLYGDGFVADADTVYCFRFNEENQLSKPVREDTRESNTRFLYLAAGSIAVGLLLMTLLLLLFKYKKQNK